MTDPSDPTDTALQRPEELVVDLRSLPAVLDRLQGMGALGHAHHVQKSNDLQLALVSGLDLTICADNIRTQYPTELEALGLETDVEAVLFDLERSFAEATGAVPVMDPHQDAFIGYPHHKDFAFPSVHHQQWTPAPPVDAGRPAVGIVDTGVERGHERLEGAVDSDPWIERPAQAVSPVAGHGTFVAGLVVEHAPGSAVHVRAGLATDTVTGSAWDIATAIAGFGGSGISVLNLSFGCVTKANRPPVLIERALARLGDDVLVVAAAGNRGLELPPPAYLWPAAAHGVVAVGSLAEGSTSTPDETTLRGSWLDCLANGTSVVSTYLHGTVEGENGPEEFDGAATWTGTSFAAARVSGRVAGAMKKDQHPREAYEELLEKPDTSHVVRYRP